MKSWDHRHTFAVGIAGGLLLDRHVLLVFALGAIVGGVATYAGRIAVAAKSALQRAWSRP